MILALVVMGTCGVGGCAYMQGSRERGGGVKGCAYFLVPEFARAVLDLEFLIQDFASACTSMGMRL